MTTELNFGINAKLKQLTLTLIREFLEPSPSAFSGEKIQNTRTYTNDVMLRSGFFPQNTLGDGPAFRIFFQDSRIRVKYVNYSVVYGQLVANEM